MSEELPPGYTEIKGKEELPPGYTEITQEAMPAGYSEEPGVDESHLSPAMLKQWKKEQAALGESRETIAKGKMPDESLAGAIPGAVPQNVQPTWKEEAHKRLTDRPSMSAGISSAGDIAEKVLSAAKMDVLAPIEIVPMAAGGMEKGIALAKPYIEKGIETVGKIIASPFKKIGELPGLLSGKSAIEGRKAAVEAIKPALEAGAKSQEYWATTHKNLQNALDAEIEAFSKPNPKNTLDAQGTFLREQFTRPLEEAKKLRAEKADEMFKEVEANAEGVKIDTGEIEKGLEEAIENSANIPSLQAEFQKQLTAVQGGSFKQLETARRYLNDVGYGTDLEGYSGIARRSAQKVARQLDDAMQASVSKFKEYKNTYREISKALDTEKTRMGKAILGKEGGLLGDVYTSVPAAELPGKIFKNKEGIEMLTDAMAGGKGAPAEARVKAAAQVDKMVENWIVESARDKTALAATEKLKAPGMQGTLEAAPRAGLRVQQRFEKMAGKEVTAKSIEQMSAKEAKVAEDLKTNLSIADSIAAQKGNKSQKEAYDMYVSMLRSARREGILTPDAYASALSLIDRVGTTDEKIVRARKMAVQIVGILAGGYMVAPAITRALH